MPAIRGQNMSETSQLLRDIQEELRLIRSRLEAIEEMLSEEMTPEDHEALKEAMDDHKKRETISLDEAIRRLP